jgi:exopolyphosphatase/pppGpp-phosphohydrolase
MTERMQHQNIRERTVNSLVARYDIDQEQSRGVLNTAQILFQATAPSLAPRHRTAVEPLLNSASTLHQIGLHINRRGIQNTFSKILKYLDSVTKNKNYWNYWLAAIVKSFTRIGFQNLATPIMRKY